MPKAVILINLKGLDGMIEAMEKVQTPTFLTTMKLEGVLNEAFQKTQEQVHTISFDLKKSGETSTDFVGGKVWSGEIQYGKGLDYAEIEMTRKGDKGGVAHPPHDFFLGLEIFDTKFEDAIDSHFKLNL